MVQFIISVNKENCQSMLDILSAWCRGWGMQVILAKSQVMHIRNHQRPRCNASLYLDLLEIEWVSEYKYFGYWMHEFLSLTAAVVGHLGE